MACPASMKLDTEKAKATLNRLLAMFESGDLPPAVARTMLRRQAGDERPSDKWSMGNRIIMLLNGTEDARGFKQWEEVNRRVKKGAKAFYILAPLTKKVIFKAKEIDPETGEECKIEEERMVVIGFRFIPVFRYEDTEGEPLPETKYAPPEPPPLAEVAKAFGVQEIIYTPSSDRSYGFYSWGENGKKIVLHTHDVKTWFHELGHAVHHTFRHLQNGQVAEQEIVAEVFAAVMCELHGIRGYHQHSWEYIRHYAANDPGEALKVIFRVLSDVEECMKRVFAAAEDLEKKSAA